MSAVSVALPGGRVVSLTQAGLELLGAIAAGGGWRAELGSLDRINVSSRLVRDGLIARDALLPKQAWMLTDDGRHVVDSVTRGQP